MKRVVELCIAVVIFLIPSNLFLQIFISSAYERGLLIDYLLPKLYLTDIVVIVTILAFYLWKKPKLNVKKLSWLTVGLLLTLIFRQFFVPHVLGSIFYLAHLIIIGLFGWCLFQDKQLVKSTIIHWSILGTWAFQACLGCYQFFMQHSLAGYWFLGEPTLTKQYGIVHQTLLESEKVLPYGTTAHPNVLAGCLVLYTLFLLHIQLTNKRSKLFLCTFLVFLPVAALALWCTQSISAGLALLMGVGVFFVHVLKIFFHSQTAYKHVAVSKKTFLLTVLVTFVIVPVVLALLPQEREDTSISRRVILNSAAVSMISHNPIWGVGLNQFAGVLEDYAPSAEVVRFIQPAHNILLLYVAETGLLGVLLLTKVLWGWLRRGQSVPTIFLCLLPLAVLDHYLLTLETGLLLVVVALFIFTSHNQG